MKRETLEEKLYTVKFKADTESHLVVKEAKNCVECGNAHGRPCLTFCPANVYEWEGVEEGLAVRYEGCLECGACRIGCPYDNIEWRYPKGALGLTYRIG